MGGKKIILEKVIDIIADELFVSPNELDADTDLRENFGIDSLFRYFIIYLYIRLFNN